MKAVFLDEIGNAGRVDRGSCSSLIYASSEVDTDEEKGAEFKDLWTSLKTPIADELADQLRAGPSPSLTLPTPMVINAVFGAHHSGTSSSFLHRSHRRHQTPTQEERPERTRFEQ